MKRVNMEREPKRVAVVTGAGGLIGRRICARLAAQEVTVLGIDRLAWDDPSLAMSIECDVSDEDQVSRAAERIRSRVPRVDVLVHSAALTGRTSPAAPSGELRSISIDGWRQLLDVNLTGALICVQQILPLMAASPDARILLIGSIQGSVPTLRSGCYGVSKAGLVGLMRQLAAELATEGVAVNLVSPAAIREVAQAGDGEWPTPMGRFGSAQEVAEVVATLIAGALPFVTGAVIPVDGGEHLRPRRSPAIGSPVSPEARALPRAAKRAAGGGEP